MNESLRLLFASSNPIRPDSPLTIAAVEGICRLRGAPSPVWLSAPYKYAVDSDWCSFLSVL